MAVDCLMTKQNPQITKALLICPDNLLTDYLFIHFIAIEKLNGKIDFKSTACVHKEIKHFFAQSPAAVQAAIAEFDHASLQAHLAEIKQALKKSGAENNEQVKQTMLRHLHGKLEKIKPLAPAVKWYHRFLEDGKYRILPCVFSNYRPALSFKVVKEAGGLNIETSVNINGTLFPLQEFRQYRFLLRSGNEYFLLSFKDFKTLEWLRDFDFGSCNKNSAQFENIVLAKLEEDYEVDRNNLFTEDLLSPEPVNRVYLNELSSSFLMLTPQWKYGDFLVEGKWEEVYKTTVQGKSYSIQRNKEKEAAFLKVLESFHPNFPNQASKGYYYVSFADAQKKQWFLKTYHRLLELDIELAGLDMLRHFRLSPHKAATTIDIVEKSEQSITLKVKIEFGKESVPLDELQKTLLAGQRAVLLKDGTLGVLGEEWLQQYSTIFKHGRVARDQVTIASWMAMHEEKEEGNNAILQKTIPQNWWQKWKEWQQGETKIYELPAMVKTQLRPYQHKGYEWMRLLSELGAGACLADDMGLGKTLQTISFIGAEIEKNENTKALIICPASLVYNWQSECKRFAPSLRVAVYHGPDREEICFTNNTQVIISTYGTIRVDFEKISKNIFSIIVLDESHNIKNPSAQITQSVTALQALYRIALSGTPVMNNTFDLYAQLNFMIPGMFGSKDFFRKEYADPIDIWGDEEKLKTLNKLTAPFILRRTKEQVAKDLPAKTEMIMWCEMGSSQKAQYNEIRDQVKSSLLDNIQQKGLAKSKLFLLQAITKLRQVCNSPLLLPENERLCSDSIKTDMLMDELVNNVGKHKSLVFSQFSSMLDLLAEECKRKGLAFFHFDGQTPAPQRAKMVEAFQSEKDNTPVFLISLKAGNAGLNLTSADYVFLFDPWWNTAVQQQAINRTHRIGQQKSVFAYQLICKDTIEEKIISIQQRKQKLSEELIATEENFLQTLSEEELMDLFS